MRREDFASPRRASAAISAIWGWSSSPGACAGRATLATPVSGSPRELEVGLITGLEPIGANLVVVKTRIGAASSVAVVLDHEFGQIAAGTIAGDDTVFVAVRSRCDQGRVVAQLNAWLGQNAAASPPPPAAENRRRPLKKKEPSE